MSGLVFWVSGLIFWVSELILNSGLRTGGRADGRADGRPRHLGRLLPQTARETQQIMVAAATTSGDVSQTV